MPQQQSMKIRARGIQIGTLSTGKKNCITDVANVRIGHVTLDEPLENGEYIATGVTAILSHAGNPFREKWRRRVISLTDLGRRQDSFS